MAHITTNPSHGVSILSIPGRIANAIWNGLVRMAENNSRIQQVNYLNSLTDEQLADKGIKRDDIVRHVFADLCYI